MTGDGGQDKLKTKNENVKILVYRLAIYFLLLLHFYFLI
jgi:hypothetical protein